MNQPPPPNSAPTSYQPPPPTTVATKAPWTNERKVAAGAAVGVVVGSLGPWSTVNTAFGSISLNGTEGDGVISLVCAVIAFGFIVAEKYVLAIVFGAIALAVTAYQVFNLSSVGNDGDGPFVTVGWGVYLAAISAFVVCAAAFQARRMSRA